ncbi:hypothetical protein L873DRAFT_92796 [Choiromyces venosus 120613-1]|uniref:Uncharacterized protein n=1 Tax=Choiromyces venosus 120613-1 TaxID=1336337 RepID=A0A3N4K3C0_9PEZI|nr:hypothetical protein L873DRAFT_92796 [Choiromyces venosus 120613-1]
MPLVHRVLTYPSIIHTYLHTHKHNYPHAALQATRHLSAEISLRAQRKYGSAVPRTSERTTIEQGSQRRQKKLPS